VALRDAFNATDRSVSDTNVDLAARLTFTATDVLSYHLGAARKTRAPSYQERYLWLPLEATAGLADGRTYTGDVDLDSEVAREVEAGFDLHTRRLRVAPRLFYRDIRDYIQGGTSGNTAAVMLVRMLNAMNGTSNPDPLEFQNVDAELYGADVDWSVTLAERWSLGGVVSYVRGRSADGDDLYRIPPLNGLVSVDYGTRRWGLSGEAYFAADQNRVARFNDEPETDGYVTFNLKGFWQATGALRLSAGVDNLTDRSYADHLAGRNRVRGNPDIAVGERLPGYGRNFFARLDLAF
jgi:iron complex outermembrane receptor protein